MGLAEDTLMVKLAKIECTKVMLGLAEGFFFFFISRPVMEIGIFIFNYLYTTAGYFFFFFFVIKVKKTSSLSRVRLPK